VEQPGKSSLTNSPHVHRLPSRLPAGFAIDVRGNGGFAEGGGANPRETKALCREFGKRLRCGRSPLAATSESKVGRTGGLTTFQREHSARSHVGGTMELSTGPRRKPSDPLVGRYHCRARGKGNEVYEKRMRSVVSNGHGRRIRSVRIRRFFTSPTSGPYRERAKWLDTGLEPLFRSGEHPPRLLIPSTHDDRILEFEPP